jgi:tyrosine-protein phosphatase YwqE
MPYPKNYLLIENSFIQEPWNLDDLIFSLTVKGFKPILAHPERYIYYHSHTKRYNEVHQNAKFQINLLSLAGYYGKNVKKMAEWLIENDLVDFIGTDLHGQRHIECLREYLSSRDARRHRDMTASHILNDTLV